jgi:hypothetical protein
MTSNPAQLAAILATILYFIFVSSTQAGTVIQQQERSPGSDQVKQSVTIYVDAGKLRVEGDRPGSGKYAMIFDEAKQVTWMADLAQGTYMEFTAAQVAQMGNQMQGMQAQMQQAMQQMQQQMANMPPEQRAMMEQMMKQQMGGQASATGDAAAARTVRQTATGQKVGQFTCTRYEVSSASQVSQQICAAPLTDLKLDPSAYETFKALAKFYEPLTRNIPQGTWSAPSGMDQIQGFPVQTVMYSNGQPNSEWRVSLIENRSLDAGLFNLPPGLKKTEMPQMPARGGMNR